MSGYSRRHFIKSGIAAGTLAGVGALPVHAARPTATDMVTLGNSGLKVTRLAFGTGSNNGHVQCALGQAEFTKLIRYAYDRGIRFFETAEAYMTPAMLGEALKGLPRDSYQLMTKVTTDQGADPLKRFDEMRKTSQTDYFDIMLLHWQHTPNWVAESARWQDGINEAQEKKIILKRGASVHGLPALRQVPGNKWLDVAMIRMNHNGTRMDGPIPDVDKPGRRFRSRPARKDRQAAGNGRHQHEAGRRRHFHAPRRSPRSHEVRLPQCRHRLRYRRFQKHAGSRRSHRQHERRVGVTTPSPCGVPTDRSSSVGTPPLRSGFGSRPYLSQYVIRRSSVS